MFKAGWDKNYDREVSSSVPSSSACLENVRSNGGARAHVSGCQAEIDFRKKCYGLKPIEPSAEVRVAVIETGGKFRVVTVGGAERQVLRPLHHVIYNHLSKKDWLLRGDAKPKNFQSFTRKSGELFVSGDYESATDNLSLSFYQHCLNTVLDTAENVPSSVKEFAMACSRSALMGLRPGGKLEFLGVQSRGQLMGNYLSFPFLCLVNYLTFKYYVRRKVPVKINGDDIVFRATKEEYERWAAGVGAAGLKLSVGKTLLSRDFFSLNSSFYRATPKRVVAVPYIRSTCAFGVPESIQALAGQYRDAFPGFASDARRYLQTCFLTRNRHVVWKSGRSLTRCLGLRVPQSVLRGAGLWDRERFYLNVPHEKPLPPSPSEQVPIPVPGWVSTPMVSDGGFLLKSRKWRAYAKKREGEWYQDVYAHIWSGDSSAKVWEDEAYEWRAYWFLVRRTGWSYCRPVHRSLTKLLFIKGSSLSRKAYGEWRAKRNVFEAAAEPASLERMWEPVEDFDRLNDTRVRGEGLSGRCSIFYGFQP
jgi:hypothetical protein